MANEGDWPPSELKPNYEPKYEPNHCIHHLLSIIFSKQHSFARECENIPSHSPLANILMYFEYWTPDGF